MNEQNMRPTGSGPGIKKLLRSRARPVLFLVLIAFLLLAFDSRLKTVSERLDHYKAVSKTASELCLEYTAYWAKNHEWPSTAKIYKGIALASSERREEFHARVDTYDNGIVLIFTLADNGSLSFAIEEPRTRNLK